MIISGEEYKVNSKHLNKKYSNNIIRIEGLWTKVFGESWTISKGNPAALVFTMRTVEENIPLSEMTDDKVYYGKMGSFGELVCECELEEI